MLVSTQAHGRDARVTKMHWPFPCRPSCALTPPIPAGGGRVAGRGVGGIEWAVSGVGRGAGGRTARALAIVSRPPTTGRGLAGVTDGRPDAANIGGRGELVLRLVAVRDGVPDYGYAFRPEVVT